MQIMNLSKTEIIITQKLTVGFEKNLKSSVYIKLEWLGETEAHWKGI